MRRKIHDVVDHYAARSQGVISRTSLFACVAVLAWSLMALMWSLPVPAAFTSFMFLNWLTIGFTVVTSIYILLSRTLAIGLILFAGLGMLVIKMIETTGIPVFDFAAFAFAAATIRIYAAQRSAKRGVTLQKFATCLLIGPAWMMSVLYRRAGIPI